jgi:hypothetical protein
LRNSIAKKEDLLLFRRHLSFANVTASLALFVALGGTGYAAIRIPRHSVGNAQLQTNAVSATKIRANAVGSSEIRANAVGSSEIRANAVGSSEIKRDGVGQPEIRRGAVTSSEIRDGSIRTADVGAGAIGSQQLADGDVQPVDLSTATKAAFQAATLRAAVDATGKQVAGNAKTITMPGAGRFVVTFDRDVSGCFYSATPATVGTATPKAGTTLRVESGGLKAPNDVLVDTFRPVSGPDLVTAASEPFHLIVDC